MGLLLWCVGLLMAASCGGRSQLIVVGGRPPSSEFCAEASYQSGYDRLSIYILLDRSTSMANDHKWDHARTAIDSFVSDPSMAGMGAGLQYFPLDPECDVDGYAIPAVPIGLLPDQAEAITASLAAEPLQGGTPTLPALSGGIIYARTLLMAEPKNAVIVVLVTDGAPNDCNSTDERLVAVASHGATRHPQVLTFVVGLKLGFTESLEKLAAAGGTGKAVFIGEEDSTAQELVDTLGSIRDELLTCRHAIPVPAGDVELSSADLTVQYQLTPEAAETELELVTPASCHATGYLVDDRDHPTKVELCPQACSALSESDTSSITVTVGCGAGSPPPNVAPPGDTGDCGGVVSFNCMHSCGGSDWELPFCSNGLWTCPQGMTPSYDCSTCPVVPHGCCHTDQTLSVASCIDGQWVCPPGAAIFGSPECTPPEVCGATMPCASGQLCHVPDFTCGTTATAGSCVPTPTGCPASDPPACGCDGQTYQSACHAQAAGVDLSITEVCTTPVGAFVCGPLFCDAGSDLCRHTIRFDDPAIFDDYACVPKPAGCATGCGCEICAPCPTESCTESCSVDEGITVDCYVW
ncbi:MAG: VWA domain-containing protein [Deltaproteobacteria bacterium]|nr:VWA domain-containing protein [Deltaproteobacteria bacterium]